MGSRTASDIDKVLVVHDLMKEWHWQRREKKLEAKRRRIKKSGAGLRDNVRNAQLKRMVK